MNTTKNSANDCANIFNLVSNIFGNETERAFDYLAELCFNPKKKQPILFLNGSQATGKTTFTTFVKKVVAFEENLVKSEKKHFNFQKDADMLGNTFSQISIRNRSAKSDKLFVNSIIESNENVWFVKVESPKESIKVELIAEELPAFVEFLKSRILN